VTWPARTARLLIRRVTADDAAAVWRYRKLPEVFDWITTAPADEDAFTAYFEDPWAQTEVKEAARGVQAEIGWVLDPSYGGQGLATEAVAAMLRICFEELRVRRVVANCFADNTGSWRLMERLGMRREAHTVSDSLHRSGRWLDGYAYALLAAEWRPVS